MSNKIESQIEHQAVNKGVTHESFHMQENSPGAAYFSQSDVRKAGDTQVAARASDITPDSSQARSSALGDVAQLAAKRTEATKDMVRNGTLPGTILDFGSESQLAKAPDSKLEAGTARPPITDKEAKTVADQFKILDRSFRSAESSLIVDSISRSLSGLSKNDIEKVNAAYGGQGAVEAAKSNPLISQNDKEKLAIYGQGVDQRQADPSLTLRLAELAIQKQSISDLRLAFAGAIPEARTAFFTNAENNPRLGQRAIDGAFNGADRVTATEFARSGKVSAATDISRETGSITPTNYEGVERTIKQFSPNETAQHIRGSQLAAQLASGKLGDLSPAQQADLSRFTEFDSALQKAAGSNSTRLEYWRALALQGGQSNGFLDAVAGDGGRVYNGNLTDKLFGQGSAEHLKNSWDKQSYEFYNDKEKGDQRRESTRHVLSTLSNGPQLIEKFNQQVNAPTYGDSLSSAGKAEEPEHKLLPQLSQAIQYTSEGFLVQASSAQILRSIETGLGSDLKLQARIADPKTPQDLAVRDELRNTVHSLLGDTKEYQQFLNLERGEKISPETWAQLDKKEGSINHRPFFEDLGRLPKEVRDRIASDPELKQKVVGHLDKDNQQIADNILKYGYRPADQLQAARLQKDSAGVEEAVRRGAQENLTQFKEDFQSSYRKRAEKVAPNIVGGEKGIAIERALAADLSPLGQFQVDQKIKSELRSPILDGIASRFGSNAPAREDQKFDEYVATIGQTRISAGNGTETATSAARAKEGYRQERDALNATEKEVVSTSTSIALTIAGGVVTGGGGWVAPALLREGGKATLQYGTIAAASVATPIIREQSLGRLHDGQASTYVHDAADGAFGVYLGGGNLGTLKLATPKFKNPDLVSGYGHVVYPFTSNFAYATGSELASGKNVSESLTKGLTNGTLATIGVGGIGWTVSRAGKNFLPAAASDLFKGYIANGNVSVPIHRGVLGGGVKAYGNQAKSPAPHGEITNSTIAYVPGTIVDL